MSFDDKLSITSIFLFVFVLFLYRFLSVLTLSPLLHRISKLKLNDDKV